MQTLKIGFVLDDSLDKPDGVQQYVLAIGEWFRSQGHDVHYLVGETKRTDVAQTHSLSRNVAVRFNRNRMSMPLPASKRELQILLEREHFDVLHVQLPYSPWLAHRIIMAAESETVVFGTFHIVAHSSAVRLATRALAGWTRASVRRFDEIVSVSSAAAEYAHRTYGVQTEVLPNVVNYRRFHEAKPLPGYGDKDVTTILFLGRLVARKGCLILLQALVRLRRTYPEAPRMRVLICGKGPLEARLKQFVTDNDLQEAVTFTGFVTEAEKPRYYASADIAVFPSTGGESFGIVLLEAMAAGRAAVLAGDNSGYRTVLAPRPEQLFKPTAENLAGKLWEFLADADRRQTAAQWGADYARQFDTARVGTVLLHRYEQALRKRPRA